MSSQVDFKYMNAELYRHPGERAAREKIEKVPAIGKLLSFLTDSSGLKAQRQAEMSSMVRAGGGVYPVLADLWTDTQRQFGLNGIPLFIAWEWSHPYALRGGNENPAVIINSRLLETLEEKEMRALLAMQAGSVRLGNASLLAAADFSRWFLDFYGILGAPAALPAWGMENWRRYALFSADRAASLMQGDPDSVCSLLQKMGGGSIKAWGGVTKPDDLRVQGLEATSLESDWSNSKVRRFALAMNRENNVSLIRRIDLQDWFAAGQPARILSGEMTEPEIPVHTDNASKDPSLAYWGEFASGGGDDDKSSGGSYDNPFTELREKAEKGMGAFFKAGEAFWNTLMDNSKK